MQRVSASITQVLGVAARAKTSRHVASSRSVSEPFRSPRKQPHAITGRDVANDGEELEALRYPWRLAVKERRLIYLGLAGEPDAVLSVGEAFEERAICLRDAVDAIRQLLQLSPLGAG